MARELGPPLIGLALTTVLYAALAALRGIHRRDPRWARSAQRALNATAGLLGLALLILLVAFLGDDFSLRYVAQHASTTMPTYLKISAIWAGQEGSLLLWCGLQALFAALSTGAATKAARPLVPWARVILGVITAFFLAVTLLHSNPFEGLSPIPVEGQGLNPLLRHPGMIFHPPALYVGYVGLAVPFAFAMAALITGRIQGWTAALRSWILIAWLGLGLGLLLGMRWAYDVLGWGGYWGWDPVENAGLLPWLTATGLLHSAVMQEERRGFRRWTMGLAVASFTLALFGTFATRSGMIQSVHAYARSDLGGTFLAAIAVTLAGAVGLLLARREALMGAPPPDSLLSRDGMFYLTLVLLSTLTASILVGSVLPTLTQALAGQRFEAGPAWFDRVTGPQFAALMLLMGVCPLLGRAAAALRRLHQRRWLIAAGTALVPGIAALAGFARALPLVGFAVVGLAATTTLAEFVAGTARRARRTDEVPPVALWRLIRRQRRKYGGYLVHLGVVLMAVGVIGTRMYPFEREVTLTQGEATDVDAYALAFEDLAHDVVDDRTSIWATVAVHRRDGAHLTTLTPRQDHYRNADTSVTVPALRPGLREDLYLTLAGWTEDGRTATFTVELNRLVNFLWLGGLIFLAGGALALWPLRVRGREVRA